jgi:hypothetical protein
MSDKRELERLGARMRSERLTPSSRLISAIVGLFPERVQRRPKASLRFALAAGLAVALVSAVAAVGGVGYAKKQVTHAVVAVKSTVQSTVSLKPSKSSRPAAPASASVQYKGAPIVTGFQPKAACPGQQITIFGSNFKNVTAVLIGGHSAKFKVNNDHIIKAWVPNGFTGGPVTVVNNKGPGTAPHSLKLKFKGCHRT